MYLGEDLFEFKKIRETYEIYELIAVALFGIAVGIDFAHAHITSNNSKMID